MGYSLPVSVSTPPLQLGRAIERPFINFKSIRVDIYGFHAEDEEQKEKLKLKGAQKGCKRRDCGTRERIETEEVNYLLIRLPFQVRYSQKRDSGTYECQVSTTPPIGHSMYLSVVGESRSLWS